jgi:hypothetical protein
MNSQAKKNAVLLVLAAAITGTVLTGCGGQQPGAKPASTKPGFSRSTEIGKEKQSDLTITTAEAATKAEKSKGNAFDDGKVKPKSDKHKGDKAKPDQSKRDKKKPDKPKKEKTTEAATTDEAKETAKEADTDKKGDNANATEQKATENSIETAETTKETKKSKSN